MRFKTTAFFLFLASAFAALVFAADASNASAPALSDSEIWNEGVDFYRAGDMTNALARLRPLMLSRSHGPRAAEVVASIYYDRARSGESPDPAGDLSEAAAAAQIALRADPGDARANRNFTRATDGLPGLMKTKHVNDVLKAAQGKDPSQMLGSAAAEMRLLMNSAAAYRTNSAPVAVSLADSLSARASRLADVWLPVKEAISASVTNEEQAATISDQVDQARAKCLDAATALGDMADGAYDSLSAGEEAFTRFFKLVAPPPAAIRADLVSQSNCWMKAEPVNGRDWQQDALDYTRAFRAKFPAWAKDYEQRAQSDTNMAPFTAETQALVSSLSTELEKLQLDSLENPTSEKRFNAMARIQEIIDLLPPEKGGSSGRQGQQGQQDKQQDKQDKQDENQQQDKQENDDDQPRETQGEQQEEEQRQAEENEEEQPSADDREIEAILKKAQERSDEHEAEKKARMRKAKLPPNERDW